MLFLGISFDYFKEVGSDRGVTWQEGEAWGTGGRAPAGRGGRGCDHTTGCSVWAVLHHERSKDNELISLFYLVVELKDMEMLAPADEM